MFSEHVHQSPKIIYLKEEEVYRRVQVTATNQLVAD